MKYTLRSKVIEDLEPYLDEDGTISRGNYPLVKNQLHTDIVDRAMRRSGPNRVLGYIPPAIHKNEKVGCLERPNQF